MRVLLLIGLLVSSLAFAQSCPEGQIFNSCDGPQFGPGPCTPGCVAVGVHPVITDPVGPAELCVTECRSVTYRWIGDLVVAESALANGYQVLGWSGPCNSADRGECPDILNQAFADLTMNAKRANRAQKFLAEMNQLGYVLLESQEAK